MDVNFFILPFRVLPTWTAAVIFLTGYFREFLSVHQFKICPHQSFPYFENTKVQYRLYQDCYIINVTAKIKCEETSKVYVDLRLSQKETCDFFLCREEEQATSLLPVLVEEQDITQRPRGGEEAGLDHRGGTGGLCPLQSR